MPAKDRHAFTLALLSAMCMCFMIGCAARQPQQPQGDPGMDLPYLNKSFDLDVRWGASPKTVMRRIFSMAELRASDVFYDLGCGDGRVVVEAVRQFGLRGRGVDIDPARILQSRELAAKMGVAGRATFINESFFETDLTDATVVFIFLNNTLNAQLRPKFLRVLRPGTRIIMHTHDMGEWTPDESEVVKCECIGTGKMECYRSARLYIVPANVSGAWRWNEAGPATMKVRQKFQKLSGEIAYGSESAAVEELRISGEHIGITVVRRSAGDRVKVYYSGFVRDDTITGTIVEKAQFSQTTRDWKARRLPSTWEPIDR